jgi:glycosyltransferase involved in cell wall biosynthesis
VRKWINKSRVRTTVNGLAERLGFRVVSYRKPGFSYQCVSVKPKDDPIGRVLLSYIIEPFLLDSGETISNAHHNHWLSYQIAQTFLGFGYEVDVVDYRNERFVPAKEYEFFVGARTNFERISRLLGGDCVKIVHLDVAHWIFHNYAQYRRLLELKQRRGTALAPRKLIETSWAIECADYGTTNSGNSFNVRTYAHANKTIHQMPIPACAVFPWAEEKDFGEARKHFIWFGSSGLIHKGLDLVVEAFAGTPELKLTICGPVRRRGERDAPGPLDVERDFEEEYRKELYDTANIDVVGWVDIASNEFREITSSAIAIVFPSCSEGGAASVITCMHAGLIPVVSYESNVDVGEFGVTLKESTVDEIRRSVRDLATTDPERLRGRARDAWETTRNIHTRERFAEAYASFAKTLVERHCSG